MVLRAEDLQEERFAESHLKRKCAYGTILIGANTGSPMRIIELDCSRAES